MNFSTFVNDERQRDGNCDRENLCDLPMRIVGAVTICFVDGVGIDLCAAVRFREPAEELGVLTFRIGGQHNLFTIDLLSRFALTDAQIPCYGVLVGRKLRVKCRAAGDRDRTVKAAARLCRKPALERVAGLDGNAAWRRRLAVRLNSFTVRCFAVNGAAVAARVPSDGQADGRAAIVALAIAVGIHMVGVFFATCLADGTGFRALMLGIAYA